MDHSHHRSRMGHNSAKTTQSPPYQWPAMSRSTPPACSIGEICEKSVLSIHQCCRAGGGGGIVSNCLHLIENESLASLPAIVK
jgi:hypothetical protein